MISWNTDEGSPFPLGVTYIAEEEAYNFAIYSKNAAQVTLLLYDDLSYTNPVYTKNLDFLVNKSQSVWHCRVKKGWLKNAVYYAYQVTGNPGFSDGPACWQLFDHTKILLDPYAKEVFFPPDFDPAAAIKPGSNAGKAPLGYIHPDDQEFNWENDSIKRHESDLVIYELHVQGFTMAGNSGVDDDIKGTFAGLTKKIPYLKELGVTAVELMPVHQSEPGKKNYWGYSTLNFFAPNQAYAADKYPGGATKEFKTMVKALHKAGIEIILDVVFNHTVEGDINGPVYSFKGIDNSTYYLLNDDCSNPFDNYSGTGNTMRTDHPIVQRLIMDSLYYWVKEMHIDGFRFDLASVFSRLSDDASYTPPIFAQLSADKDFQQVRLIAEPWDAGGKYQLGRAFPGDTWSQWNGKYRDDIRSFVKSDKGLTGAAITRIYGSDDLFPDTLINAYKPWQSINFINCHDGFTLYDLVAYNNKHNESNGQNNTDGSNENNSWNCGWEGDVNVPGDVMALRLRQAKNFFTLLMLSNGTPMFFMGDEFLHSQNGNNNPYNQNNAISWLNWDLLTSHKEHFNFTKKLLAFKQQFTSISRNRFWRNDFIVWGFDAKAIDFSNPGLLYFAYHLKDSNGSGKELYVMINAHWQPLNFLIAVTGTWKQSINTYLSEGEDIKLENEQEIATGNFLVMERSVVVLSR